MSKNGDDYDEENENNINNNKITVPDIFLEEFHNNITIERIRNLYNKLQTYENKGYVTHDKYLESMKEIFDIPLKEKMIKLYNEKKIMKGSLNLGKNIEETIHEIYEVYFLRFREVKCLMKNDKTVFYLTDFKPVNYINTYNLICSLTVFVKSPFDNKIKLLFDLTDIDEDGFLNETEIRYMITTCNFLFCDETNIINTNSAILSQSLMNLKVNDIIKKILYEPGKLYSILEEEKYINFDVLYNSIIKVKGYKYNIIPSFVNLKQCLNNRKNEKVIKVEGKYKNDFITISSALFTQKNFGAHRNMFNRSLSTPHLGSIIKPRKLSEENDKNENNLNDNLELPNINKNFFYRRKSILRSTLNNFSSKYINNNKLTDSKSKTTFSSLIAKNKHRTSRNLKRNRNKLIIEKKKTFKDLLKETTIIENKEDKAKENEKLKNFNRTNYYNKPKTEAKYIFEAYLDKIRNIEVKPGLIKFIGENNDKEKEKDKDKEKEKDKDNSSASGSIKNIATINNNQNNNNVNNNINNKSIRKISEEKKKENSINIFRLNSKNSLIDKANKDLEHSVIKEEVSSEEEDSKEEKKSKKNKLINTQNKSNNKSLKKQNSKFIQNTIKRENKKNLTSHRYNEPITENVSRIRNYSFNQKKRPSIFLRKKISIINQKQVVNIQKSVMNTNLNNFNHYKTLDQVFKEINFQESKFNTDSYSGFGSGLIKLSNKIEKEYNDMEKIFKKGEKKRKALSFGKEYLRRIANSRNGKPVFNKEESESNSFV